jgi:hypothetical protein
MVSAYEADASSVNRVPFQIFPNTCHVSGKAHYLDALYQVVLTTHMVGSMPVSLRVTPLTLSAWIHPSFVHRKCPAGAV